jgi:hypothetical protein
MVDTPSNESIAKKTKEIEEAIERGEPFAHLIGIPHPQVFMPGEPLKNPPRSQTLDDETDNAVLNTLAFHWRTTQGMNNNRELGPSDISKGPVPSSGRPPEDKKTY